MPSSRGSSWPRDRTHVSYVSALVSRFFTTSTTWEALFSTSFYPQVSWTGNWAALCQPCLLAARGRNSLLGLYSPGLFLSKIPLLFPRFFVAQSIALQKILFTHIFLCSLNLPLYSPCVHQSRTISFPPLLFCPSVSQRTTLIMTYSMSVQSTCYLQNKDKNSAVKLEMRKIRYQLKYLYSLKIPTKFLTKSLPGNYDQNSSYSVIWVELYISRIFIFTVVFLWDNYDDIVFFFLIYFHCHNIFFCKKKFRRRVWGTKSFITVNQCEWLYSINLLMWKIYLGL